MTTLNKIQHIKHERIQFLYKKLSSIIAFLSSEEKEKFINKLKSLPIAVRINGLATVAAHLKGSDMDDIYEMMKEWFLEKSPQKILHDNSQDFIKLCIQLNAQQYLLLQREAQLFFEDAKLLAEAIVKGE